MICLKHKVFYWSERCPVCKEIKMSLEIVEEIVELERKIEMLVTKIKYDKLTKKSSRRKR